MHLAIVSYHHEPGLDPQALLDLYPTLTGWAEAVAAAAADTRVTVIQRCARDAEIKRNGVHYQLLADGARPVPQPWAWPRRVHAAVAALNPDLVHLDGLIYPLQAWLLRRSLPSSTALVMQDHATVPPAPLAAVRSLPARLRRLAVRAGFASADGFLFSAAAQAQPWRQAGLIGPEQQVFEVMESSRPFRPQPRAASRVATGLAGNPALLWVGHLDDNKDPLTVLDGFERSRSALPDAHLTFIFRGTALRPELERRLAARPGLADHVHLVGDVPPSRMEAFFSAADLFVLGSHREGSGYALIEALACAAIPVVTDIPSFRVLTDGGTLGPLWPPGDAPALAAALVSAARRDPAPLRAAITQHFERHLSWSALGRRALAAYQACLARRRGIPRNSGPGGDSHSCPEVVSTVPHPVVPPPAPITKETRR